MRGIILEDVGKGGGEEVRVGGGEDQRRAELDDVLVGAVGAGKDAAIAEAVDHVEGLIGGGGACGAVVDEVDAEEKTGAANVTEKGVGGLEKF